MILESDDVERSVIGLIVMFEEFQEKIQVLDKSDFNNPLRVKIFNCMKHHYNQNGKVDLIILISELDGPEKQELVNCAECSAFNNRFDDYFTRLLELSRNRRLYSRVSGLLFEDFSLNDLQQIVDDENNKSGVSSGLEKGKKNIDAFIGGLGKQKPRIMTGFSTIDKVTGGIRKGCVFYLGARPSTGKTSFAINVAANQQRFNQKVLMFSLEMSSEMIFERLASSELFINYNKFSTQTLDDKDKKEITEFTEKYKSNENIIVLDDIYTIEAICNTISEIKPDLVIVDFMQVITTTQQFKDPRNKIDYISSEFKRIAKRLGCVVMVLSQLSRNGKDAPTMSDLKESGGLEADGDYIALLHRPYVLKKDDPSINPETTELLFDKNKFGRTGKMDLKFELKYQKFYEIEQYRESSSDYNGTPFEVS